MRLLARPWTRSANSRRGKAADGPDGPRHRPASNPVGALGLANAALAASGCLVLVNAVAITATLRVPPQGRGLRALHLLHEAGQHLALGLFAALSIWAFQRWGPRRSGWGYALLAAVSLAVGFSVLPEDLSRFAGRVAPGSAAPIVLAVLISSVSLGIPAAALVGRMLARPWIRWTALVLGICALVANNFILHRGYSGAHLYLAWAATTLIACSQANAARFGLSRLWPRLRSHARVGPLQIRPLALPYAAAGMMAGFTLAAPPDNVLLVEMLKVDGSVIVPYLSRLRVRQLVGDVEVPERWRPWFKDRSKMPPIPAGEPPLLPRNAIVILITVDSFRADMFYGGRYDADIPALARFRDHSVDFRMARTPGAQTVTTVAALFAGKYFSQQYWSRIPRVRDLWPHRDPTVRFSQILMLAGVKTWTAATTKFLTNRYGLVRGFLHDRHKPGPGKWYAYASQVMPRLRKLLRKHGDGPLFAYVHLLDAHYTMSPLGKGLPREKQFVKNLGLIDRQIGPLLDTIARRSLEKRTAVIIAGDHGEAFGQHGIRYHSKTLYEELLRVPLMIMLPNVAPRKVRTPASIIDLGPTILDLMGEPTPAHFMGQSLTGFLRGQNPELTRPIIAEGHLKKALVFPDGYKVIADDRHNTVELYDLHRDRREGRNLYRDDSPLAIERLKILRKFFRVHTIRMPGYEVPFRL